MNAHLVIVGGGLAGLSAGCHARASGFRTTIVEHGPSLGGVCASWKRDPYTIDGCIHWLTGGAFDRYYQELGILPAVERRVLAEWMTYRDARSGIELHLTRDLDLLAADLAALAPEDRHELRRLIDCARAIGDLEPPADPRELTPWREQLAQLWEMRHQAGALWHFRAPIAHWSERLHSPLARRLIQALMPPEAPALFFAMVLGYLERGYLSRPVGGTARFRDALIASYLRAGGEVQLGATVDEILVSRGRATGVRLVDGTMLEADAVISTSSLPETATHLLGGRFGAAEVQERMAEWRLFEPILLMSFGVAVPLREQPPLMMLDGLDRFEVGGVGNERLYVRVGHDDPSLAPPGHTVVQALPATSYDWWATRGGHYAAAKDEAAATVLAVLEHHLPAMRGQVRMTDVSTPLTFWRAARSWRGAYEGWMPTPDASSTKVKKTLGELRGFYAAGQWVEPGGGVPTAILSGRQAVQLLCAEREVPFRHAT